MNLNLLSIEKLIEIERSLVAGLNANTRPQKHQDLFSIHQVMAQKLLPGTMYYDWLKKFHVEFGVQTYLEIGVETGSSIRLVGDSCNAVGVDPAIRLKGEFPDGVSFIEATSDEFFANSSGDFEDYFDLIFIDGDHTAKQSLKDFINSLRCLKPSGQIIFHDVLPISKSVATPKRNTIFWTGDVWRISFVICNDELPWKWRMIPTPPSGLLCIYDVDKNISVDGDKLLDQLGSVSLEKFPGKASWPFTGLVNNDLSYHLKI